MGACAAASPGSGGIAGRTAARGLRFWEGRTEEGPRLGDPGLMWRPRRGRARTVRLAGRGGGRKGAWWLAARVQCVALPLSLAGRGPWADFGPRGPKCESSERGCVHQTCAVDTLSVHCHTRGRVERASPASLRSAVSPGNVGRRRKDGKAFVCGAFVRACLSQINFPCTCFSSLCECVTLTSSLGLKISGNGSAVLELSSSVRGRAPLGRSSCRASAMSGLGRLGR